MTVMDMTPEDLFSLVEPHRAAGELEARHVDRCELRHCHLVGFYVFRGTAVVIATPFKLSAQKAGATGLPRRVPGRAWIGERLPRGTYFGCDHRLAQEL